MEFKCENCGWSKVVGSSIFCEYSKKETFRENCCEAWKPKNNPVTNADKIRHMSDEELADFIARQRFSEVNPIADTLGIDVTTAFIVSRRSAFDWLKQEVESDD